MNTELRALFVHNTVIGIQISEPDEKGRLIIATAILREICHRNDFNFQIALRALKGAFEATRVS